MEIYLDNETCPPPPSGNTIYDLVTGIRPQLESRNRMIVSILCNNAPVPEDNIDHVLKQDLDAYERLDLVTVSVPELASDALSEARSLLHDSRQQQGEVQELLSQDKTEQALQILNQCTASWVLAHESVVKTIKLLGLNIDNLTYKDSGVLDILGQVTHQLTQLKECLQARDFVLLNDLLQYEITPFFDRWEGMITAILDAVRDQPPSAQSTPPA